MHQAFRRGLLLALPLLGLSACQMPDPVFGEAKWNFTGVNSANLATMVDNPMDLVRGQSGGAASGVLATTAVMRLRRDQVKTLPSTDTTQSVGSSGGSSPGQSGGVPAEVQ
jgi:hypothetical protein